MLTQPSRRTAGLSFTAMVLSVVALVAVFAAGQTQCAQAANGSCAVGDTETFASAITVNTVNGDDVSAFQGASDDELLYVDAANDRVGLSTSSPGALLDIAGTTHISNGSLFIGDTANSDMTTGITINQGSASDEILTFKSSSVSHAMTSLAEADTFGAYYRLSSTEGGLNVGGYGEAGRGAQMFGRVSSNITAKTTSALAPVVVIGQLDDGAGSVTDMGSNANVFAVANNGTTVMIVDAEGDLHVDGSGTLTTFDHHEDIELLRSLRSCTNKGRDPQVSAAVDNRPLTYTCGQLENFGFITDDAGPDDAPMVNMTATSWLTMDALRQLADNYEARMSDLEARLAALEGK